MDSRLTSSQTHVLSGGYAGFEGPGFVGGLSPAMLTLETMISEIAQTSIPVLLVGESGTGKQMFAHRIHTLSRRSEEALVKIACAAMTREGLTDELGMNGKGGSQSSGRSAAGSAGTILLDEISELDGACQRALLLALPDGEERPRGVRLVARLISTTSQNLDEEIRGGRFRSELYYRINGVCLRLPPLRERQEDITMLAEYFVTKHAALLGRPRRGLRSRTLQILSDYGWPGNIRQLENVVKNIVALGDEDLAINELAAGPAAKRPAITIPRTDSLKVASRAASREAERELILKALERTRWNRKRAAQELQISYKSLLYKLKQIGMPDEEAN
jgi:two-component system, NtrC family, response regulator AtoC